MYQPNCLSQVSVSKTKLNELTGWQLKEMIHKGRVSSEEIVSSVFDQIRRVNPDVNAYLTPTG